MKQKEQNTKILVVDDSPESIDLLGNALSQEYHVQVAMDGMKYLSQVGS